MLAPIAILCLAFIVMRIGSVRSDDVNPLLCFDSMHALVDVQEKDRLFPRLLGHSPDKIIRKVRTELMVSMSNYMETNVTRQVTYLQELREALIEFSKACFVNNRLSLVEVHAMELKHDPSNEDELVTTGYWSWFNMNYDMKFQRMMSLNPESFEDALLFLHHDFGHAIPLGMHHQRIHAMLHWALSIEVHSRVSRMDKWIKELFVQMAPSSPVTEADFHMDWSEPHLLVLSMLGSEFKFQIPTSEPMSVVPFNFSEIVPQGFEVNDWRFTKFYLPPSFILNTEASIAELDRLLQFMCTANEISRHLPRYTGVNDSTPSYQSWKWVADELHRKQTLASLHTTFAKWNVLFQRIQKTQLHQEQLDFVQALVFRTPSVDAYLCHERTSCQSNGGNLERMVLQMKSDFENTGSTLFVLLILIGVVCIVTQK